MQGFPENWTLPSAFDERQIERIDSLRYHAIGNAVTPPVAEWVGKRLTAVMARQDGIPRDEDSLDKEDLMETEPELQLSLSV